MTKRLVEQFFNIDKEASQLFNIDKEASQFPNDLPVSSLGRLPGLFVRRFSSLDFRRNLNVLNWFVPHPLVHDSLLIHPASLGGGATIARWSCPSPASAPSVAVDDESYGEPQHGDEHQQLVQRAPVATGYQAHVVWYAYVFVFVKKCF